MSGQTFCETDFRLIEQHSMSSYRNRVFPELRKYKKKGGQRCSDIAMSISNVLISNPVSRIRYNIRLHDKRRSVINIWAQDKTLPAMKMIAIFEPLSHNAQKITPILLALQNVVNTNIQIFLNCIENRVGMPLKSFFRFVINEKPNFTESTSDGWPQNTAFFDSVPFSPLFTFDKMCMVVPGILNFYNESGLNSVYLEKVDEYDAFSNIMQKDLQLSRNCFD